MTELQVQEELPQELIDRASALVLAAGKRQSVAGAEKQRAALLELLHEARQDVVERAVGLRGAYDSANEDARKQRAAVQKEKDEKSEILSQMTMLLNTALKLAWMIQRRLRVSPMNKVMFQNDRLTVTLEGVLAKLIIRTAEAMEVRRSDGDAQSATVRLDEKGVVFTEELFLAAFLGLPLDPARLPETASLLPEEEAPTATCSQMCGYVPSASPSMEVASQVRAWWRQMGFELIPLNLLLLLVRMVSGAQSTAKRQESD